MYGSSFPSMLTLTLSILITILAIVLSMLTIVILVAVLAMVLPIIVILLVMFVIFTFILVLILVFITIFLRCSCVLRGSCFLRGSCDSWWTCFVTFIWRIATSGVSVDWSHTSILTTNYSKGSQYSPNSDDLHALLSVYKIRKLKV